MTQQKESPKSIILYQPAAMTRRTPSWPQVWKPKHALPVVGAAAMLWIAKRAASALLTRQSQPAFPIRPLVRLFQQKPAETTTPEPAQYRIVYYYHRRTIIRSRKDTL